MTNSDLILRRNAGVVGTASKENSKEHWNSRRACFEAPSFDKLRTEHRSMRAFGCLHRVCADA